MLRQRGRYASAWHHAGRAAELPRPDGALFLDLSVYCWRARDELATSGWYLGYREQCAALWRELLANPHLPAQEYARICANLAMC